MRSDRVKAGPPASRALREWREYEEAVKRKDLASALRFLKSQSVPGEVNEDEGDEVGMYLFGKSEERDWEVLDACLNADDMKLVTSAYALLKDRGFLPNFGKFRSIGKVSHPSLDFSS